MRQKLQWVVLMGLFLSSCSGSLPTANAVPSPALASTPEPARLITEIELETQTGTAYTLSWSPDGSTLAVASGAEITLLNDDLKEIESILQPEGGALGVTWKPDMTQFATVNGFRNPTITIWDWDSAEGQITRSQQIQAEADQYGVAWSPDGKSLATLANDQKSVIQIWDADTWSLAQTYDLPYTHPRRTLQWSRDSSTVYGAGQMNEQIVVFFALSVISGDARELGKFTVSEAEVFAIAPDEKRFAVSDARGVGQIVDIASGEILSGFKSVNQTVDLAWNPDGTTLAILDYKTKLQLWNIPR